MANVYLHSYENVYFYAVGSLNTKKKKKIIIIEIKLYAVISSAKKSNPKKCGIIEFNMHINHNFLR